MKLDSQPTHHILGKNVVRAALVAATLLAGLTTNAWAQGSISGTVTTSSPVGPLVGSVVAFFDLNSNSKGAAATATTDGAGHYTGNLPAGSYAVLTQNNQGYINKIHSNLPCPPCNTNSLTPVVVTTGAITGIDFVLDPGGRISGTITDSGTTLAIAGIQVNFFAAAPNDTFPFTTAITDGAGHYISDGGMPTGNFWVATQNTLGYQDEVYNNIKCLKCNITTVGSAVATTLGATTTGIDLALDPGGWISGHIQDVNGAPLANVIVSIYDSAGNVLFNTFTNGSGNYSAGGLPTGTYYAQTHNALGLSDKAYNDVLCADGFCNFLGTPISVTSPSTTANINFVLSPGGKITGTVTNAVGSAPLSSVFVEIADAFGTVVAGAITNGSGVYTTGAVPAGTYYVLILRTGYLSQLYDNLPCVGFCALQAGTPIAVATNSTTSVPNFAMWPVASSGSISGTVTSTETTLPVNGVQVQVALATNGAVIASQNTNSSGVYTISGLAPGSYYVKTNTNSNLVNQVYNGVTCVGCALTASGATPVQVAASTTTSNINFSLATGGRISGVITNFNGGAFLSGVSVQVFNASGLGVGQASTDGSGAYTTQGLPAGTYYVRTNNALGFINKVYTNVSCPVFGCNVLTGMPITVTANNTTSGISLALNAGGRISGTVTNATSTLPLANVIVQFFDVLGVNLGNAPPTDASGNYISQGLPAGTYYVRTTNGFGLIDKLYDNGPCPSDFSCPLTAGTAVTVTGTATTTGVNFALSAGPAISGRVVDSGTTLPLAGVQVQVFDSSGVFAKSALTLSNGYYTVGGLPDGTYYAHTSVGGTLYYEDELYSDMACYPSCTVTSGTAIVLTTGTMAGATGVNFTLTPGGGAIAGTVTDAMTGIPIPGVKVQIYTFEGVLAKFVAATAANGTFAISGLPPGTYYARTAVANSVNYVDGLYSNKPCLACAETTGTAIVVTNGATTSGIDFPLAPNLIRNSQFEAGTTAWSLFATSTGPTPDYSYIESNLTGGVFQFRRLPQLSGQPVNQAVVFESTGAAVGSGTALSASFQLGNTSNVRKYMKVLISDVSFNDLAACTFWFEPHAPLRTYQMKMHSTIAWTNATISFYASSVKTDDAYYRVDNVTLQVVPAGSTGQTECIDPTAPTAGIGAPGPDLLTNGNFNTGVLTPWSLFGTITARNPIVGGVFEFIRPAVTPPAGLVLQLTGQAMTLHQLLTLNLQLGNSSTVRKRALILVNDSDFSDLIACTFWLSPGQALSNYRMTFYTTKAWTNAQVSIYPSTTGPDQWIQLDNVTMQRTPAAVTFGTECVEPSGLGSREVAGDTATPNAVVPEAAPPASTGFSADGFTPSAESAPQAAGPTWETMAEAAGTQTLDLDTPIDLVAATQARLRLLSWLSSTGSRAEVQARAMSGGDWLTVSTVAPSDTWTPIEVSLDDFLGQVIEVRLVLVGAAPLDPAAPDTWRVGDFGLEVSTAPIGP